MAEAAKTLKATTGQLATLTGARLDGPGDIEVTAVDPMHLARPGSLTFIRSAAYARQWPACKASAAIVSDGLAVEAGPERALLFVPSADLAIAKLLEFVAEKPRPPAPGVHPSSVVEPGSAIAPSAHVGPQCSIGAGSVLEDGVVLVSGVHVGRGVRIGRGSTLHPGVTIQDRCVIGARCILHPGVVIGADGFNYVPRSDGSGLQKIPHVGAVEIGDEVEIGANSCIDRGKFGNTTIGSGTKIDNLVQIAHNCVVGRCCIICGCASLAGSAVLGDRVTLGGGVGISDGITVGPGATVGPYAGVIEDVPPGETWLGGPAGPARETMRAMAVFRRLPDLARDVKRLRERLEDKG